jgi:hypothetical protein
LGDAAHVGGSVCHVGSSLRCRCGTGGRR